MDSSLSSSSISLIKISLHIHKIVSSLQSENGLKHNDHLHYRAYLTRKLQRIRSSLGLKYGKGKLFEYQEITTEMILKGIGKEEKNGKDQQEKQTTEKVESGYLLIPLLLAERAWSHGNIQKDSYSKTGKSKLHHGEIKSYHKAIKWAKKLEELCQVVCDEHTILESKAYTHWLIGQEMLERDLLTS